MTPPLLREPEQVRQDCARKVRAIETSGMFTAILGGLLGEDWTDPKIEEPASHSRPLPVGVSRRRSRLQGIPWRGI